MNMSLKNINTLKKLTQLTVEEVKELQQLLVQSGFPLDIDGILGEKTKTAFTSFKQMHNLTEPTLIGKTTVDFLIKYTTQYFPSTSKLNSSGIKLIKEFEGFRSEAYLCPDNVSTIGYGATFYLDGRKVKLGDRISEPEAEKLLLSTISLFAKEVTKLVTVPLTENQFNALVSFTFNVGVDAFKNSTLLKKLNRKQYAGAAFEFTRWVKGGGKTLPGLVKRRNAEKALFLR